MPRQRYIPLTEEQRRELEQLRDTGQPPYLRERAAAILLVAGGQTGLWVAQAGLSRPHKPDTIYTWLDRYLADGTAGLSIRPGRGPKRTVGIARKNTARQKANHQPIVPVIVLSAAQRQELLDVVETTASDHERDRVTAILLASEGWPIKSIARRGLARLYKTKSVSDWLEHYCVMKGIVLTLPLPERSKQRGGNEG